MIKNNKITKKTYGLEARRQVFLVLVILSIVLFSVNFVNAATTVTLNSPPNYLNNSLNIVNFDCSATTDSGYISNISLYTNLSGSFRNDANLTYNNLSNITNMTFSSSGPLKLFKSWNFNYHTLVKDVYVFGTQASGASNNEITVVFFYRNGTTYNKTILIDNAQYTFSNPNVFEDIRNVSIYAGYTSGTGKLIVGASSFKTLSVNSSEYTTVSQLVSSNYINLFSGGNNVIFPNITLPNYLIWNCEACTSTNECSFATSNYSINYDTTLNSVSYNSTTYET